MQEKWITSIEYIHKNEKSPWCVFNYIVWELYSFRADIGMYSFCHSIFHTTFLRHNAEGQKSFNSRKQIHLHTYVCSELLHVAFSASIQISETMLRYSMAIVTIMTMFATDNTYSVRIRYHHESYEHQFFCVIVIKFCSVNSGNRPNLSYFLIYCWAMCGSWCMLKFMDARTRKPPRLIQTLRRLLGKLICPELGTENCYAVNVSCIGRLDCMVTWHPLMLAWTPITSWHGVINS